MKHYLNNSSIMDYNTLITRLENLYLPLFSWPISAKHVLNNEIVFGRTHYAAIEYILSVAKSRDGHDKVDDIEMNVVKDVVRAIYFVFASNSDFLHIHGKEPLGIYLSNGRRENHEINQKYSSSSFPFWMRYIDGDEGQEIFWFLFVAYYECIERFPEYCDSSLYPFFNYLIDRLSNDNLSNEKPVDLESLAENLHLPIASVRHQVMYFKDRAKTLENQLSESERNNNELREKLIDTSRKLCESEIRRFGIPDREYLVRINNGLDYRLRVYDSIGKVLKLVDIESTLRDVISWHLDVPLESVTPEAYLGEDLNADSLDTVEIIMKLEEIFGMNIKDEEFVNIRTFGDVVAVARANILCSVEIYDIEALDSLLGDSYEII